MDPRWYRLRFFLDVSRLLVPSLALTFVTRVVNARLGFWLVPSHLAAIFAVFFARVHYSTWKQARNASALNARIIPCVVGKWPGNLDVLLKILSAAKTGYMQESYYRLFEEYQSTTLNTRILWTDQIISMDSQHTKFVLATGFEHFWRGKGQKERYEKFVGDGIFNRDDEMWKMHRSMARPFFAWERISDFEQFEKYSSRTISILKSFAESGQPCDVQDLHTRFALDSSADFLLGQHLNTLSASLPVANAKSIGAKGSETHDKWGAFVRAFDLCQDIAMRRSRIGRIWPLFELFEDSMEEPARVIRQWLEPIVEEVVNQKTTDSVKNVSIEEKTFLQHLVESTEDLGLIRDQLLSIMIASRDTSACLLTYVVYVLATHPDVMHRLRDEVLDICGQTGTPTSDTFREMKYLRAVLNETLRVFPPVPLNVRESRAASCVFPPGDPTYPNTGPLFVPGGTPIMYFPMLIQRSTTLWGSDADAFDPERWLDPERVARYTANPLMFQPFSAGPRICIGQNYAYNQASFFLVRLLQEFDSVTLASDAQPESTLPPETWKTGRGRQKVEKIWPSAAMTLFVKGGLWVRFGKKIAASQ